MKKIIYKGREPQPDFDKFIMGIKELGAELISGRANPRFGTKIQGYYNLTNFGVCFDAYGDGCGESRPVEFTATGSKDSISKVEKIILDEISARDEAYKRYHGVQNQDEDKEIKAVMENKRLENKQPFKHNLLVGLLSVASAVGLFGLGSYLNNKAEDIKREYPVITQLGSLREEISSLDDRINALKESKPQNYIGDEWDPINVHKMSEEQYKKILKLYDEEIEKLSFEKGIYDKKFDDLKNTIVKNNPNFFNNELLDCGVAEAYSYLSFAGSITAWIYSLLPIYRLIRNIKRGKKNENKTSRTI